MNNLNELQLMSAECHFSYVYNVFYIIIKFYLVWLELCPILIDIGSTLQQLQDLIISATDLTGSKILLLRKISENVNVFG